MHLPTIYTYSFTAISYPSRGRRSGLDALHPKLGGSKTLYMGTDQAGHKLERVVNFELYIAWARRANTFQEAAIVIWVIAHSQVLANCNIARSLPLLASTNCQALQNRVKCLLHTPGSSCPSQNIIPNGCLPIAI